MKKHFIIFISLFAFYSCQSNTHLLDLNQFTIEVPMQWQFKPEKGIDSFFGNIEGPNISLGFDCSGMGYANRLIQTEQEYLKKERWWDERYFMKDNVIYTNNSPVTIRGVRADEMKKRGITDTSLIKVEGFPQFEAKKEIHRPTAAQHKQFPGADYVADATYRDSTVFIPITIPAEIKAHHIQVDSDAHFVYKTIWPKVTGKGMTGIYIQSRLSDFNFEMAGRNLSSKNQAMALQVFKTIKFKK